MVAQLVLMGFFLNGHPNLNPLRYRTLKNPTMGCAEFLITLSNLLSICPPSIWVFVSAHKLYGNISQKWLLSDLGPKRVSQPCPSKSRSMGNLQRIRSTDSRIPAIHRFTRISVGSNLSWREQLQPDLFAVPPMPLSRSNVNHSKSTTAGL